MRRRPGVNPVSVFCVAEGISKRSFTGGISPLAIARKYLHLRWDHDHFNGWAFELILRNIHEKSIKKLINP